MKKTLVWVALLAAVAMCAIWMVGGYNKMVTAEENVENAWGQVQAQYQRRMDLIPSIVSSVQGLADAERLTFTEVMEARSKATAVTIDPSNMTEEQLANFQRVQGELQSSLSRLLVTIEKYPELNTHKEVHALIVELEGTANRITVARNNFNDVAKEFNTLVRRFPNNIVAGMFGFEKKPYFKADEGAEKAPEVKFDFNKKE